MATRVFCIVNPASAAGKTRARLPAVQRGLGRAFEDLEVISTEGRGHATVLARDALERGADLVVAVGGDGTANEVLAGFVDEAGKNRFTGAELGIVASGTGADFVRHLGMASFDRQLRAVVDAPGHLVDYGIAKLVSGDGHPITRPFLNEASVGLSGLVVELAHRAPRFWGATATYLVSSVRGLLQYREKGVTMVLDDGVPREMPLTLAVIGNGQYFGGGMKIVPEASCTDGLFDIVYTGGISKARFAGLLARVFSGRHVESDAVTTLRTTSVKLLARDERDVILIDLDGEQPGRLPAVFQIVPRGIRVRAAGLPAAEVVASGRFSPVRPPEEERNVERAQHGGGKLLH